jgi:hypothetical protein
VAIARKWAAAEATPSATPGAPAEASGIVLRLPLQPKALLRVLVIISVTFAAISAVVVTLAVLGVNLPFDQLTKRLDVDAEQAIPAWFSSMDLFLCALLIATIAVQERGSRFVRHWWVLAAGFVVMSIDEAVSLHELLNEKLDGLLGTGPKLVWGIPAMILCAAIGVAFVPFLHHLPRKCAVMFLVAGATFVFAAAGLEQVGGAILDAHGGIENPRSNVNFPYTVETTTEELLEMLSVALFAYALASYAGERPTAAPPSRAEELQAA